MSKRGVNASVATGSLLLGGICYVFLRAGSYVSAWFDGVFWVVSVRGFLQQYPLDFLRYYLPDFLWGLSLSCYLQVIYKPRLRGTIICAGTAFFCGALWEFLQFSALANGTGDLLDVGMYLLASAISVLINLKERTL